MTQLERTRASVVMNINESHYSASPRAEEGEGSRGSRAVRLRSAMWVRLCRRSARWRPSEAGRFPPETSHTIGRLWRHAIGELIAPAPTPTTTSRRLRVVKRKYTKRRVKRSRHHDWPQPNRPPDQAVVI